MERIAILGCAGSGKSTLAANISRRTGVPVIHLDDLFYRRGWTVAPEREAQRSLDAAIAGQRWVIDGNFLAAGAERFRRAQAVVFLDRSPAACLRRVLRRRLPFAATRGLAGLPQGCAPVLNVHLVKWIWNYPRVERPEVLRLLAGLTSDVTIHHLRSDEDVNRFLDSL